MSSTFALTFILTWCFIVSIFGGGNTLPVLDGQSTSPTGNGTEVDSQRPRDCSSPPITGPCKASFELWTYNSDKKRCEEFIYGGCDGNDNRYDTKELCLASCNANTNATASSESP